MRVRERLVAIKRDQTRQKEKGETGRDEERQGETGTVQ